MNDAAAYENDKYRRENRRRKMFYDGFIYCLTY